MHGNNNLGTNKKLTPKKFSRLCTFKAYGFETLSRVLMSSKQKNIKMLKIFPVFFAFFVSNTCVQCCGSGSSWIPILFALLDPDPYIIYGSGSSSF